MTALSAHDRSCHAAEDGMIATLGLLPGTWIGEVEASKPYAPAGAQGADASTQGPRQATFRGCWRSLKRFGGRRRSGQGISRARLAKHEVRMDQEVTNLFQEVFPETLLPDRELFHAIAKPSTAPSSTGSRRATPAPRGDLAMMLPCYSQPPLQQRPQSSPSKGSRATPRRRQTSPKGCVDPSMTAGNRAYEHLKYMRPHCGPWQAPGDPIKRPGLKQASRFAEDRNIAEDDEAAYWRLHFPAGSEWAKTKRVPKWNFCRVTGPWANRMSSGSVMNYRQWGPDGPLWTLADKK